MSTSEGDLGAATRIGTDFGFELESTNGAVDPAPARLAGKAVVLAVGGFRILPAMGADLIESPPCRTQLTPLLVGRR